MAKYIYWNKWGYNHDYNQRNAVLELDFKSRCQNTNLDRSKSMLIFLTHSYLSLIIISPRHKFPSGASN